MQACGGNLVSQICEQQSVSLLHGSPLPLQAIVISIATNMMAMTNNKIQMDNCRAFGNRQYYNRNEMTTIIYP
ncbi:hypothetical protein DERF_002047 [Dermatophagoides farinae]|uniref:Uncharacterized protein n=1 Tax=Dermatophagoides farinae TaxID=6954 RepID=A0A922IEY9_DERFA|nr:hypothetical protein DERF_002047 [Dermatophagoides farinae]